jgi:AcrR family transcriptional regulator
MRQEKVVVVNMAKKSLPSETDGVSNGIDSGDLLRADARRNRTRLLAEAYKLFAAGGLSVPIDEIARHAGVGIGTLYRNFPTKESLFEAAMLSYTRQLINQAKSLCTSGDPGAAFFGFFSQLIEESITNKALVDSLAGVTGDKECTPSGTSQELKQATGELLTRAQQAGVVRQDIKVEDLNALLAGILLTVVRSAEDAGLIHRMISVVCDGLRYNSQ